MQIVETAEGQDSIGLAGGAKAIARSRHKFSRALEKIVRLASLQTAFRTLDDAIKLTNR